MRVGFPTFLGFIFANLNLAVAVVFRLRKYRGQLSTTLSSTGSGLDASKFLKLFLMSCSIFVLYLPGTCYFFYLNIPTPFVPYSWSTTHTATWGENPYFSSSELPGWQYYPWASVSIGYIVFLWYGLNVEAIERYRRYVVKCGFAKIWPSLNEPYQLHRRGSSGGNRSNWTHHFDVIGKAVHYLDGGRKESHVSSMRGPESESQG